MGRDVSQGGRSLCGYGGRGREGFIEEDAKPKMVDTIMTTGRSVRRRPASMLMLRGSIQRLFRRGVTYPIDVLACV